MKYLMTAMLALCFAFPAAEGQDEKKDEAPAVPPTASEMTEQAATDLYFKFCGKLYTADQNVPDGMPMFIAQMAILADHSTVFSEDDKKILDDCGVAFFAYTRYFDEIIGLMPPNLEETPSELVKLFSDKKQLTRITAVVDAMTVLSLSIASKINALIDKIPPSDRLEKYMIQGYANYEAAK